MSSWLKRQLSNQQPTKSPSNPPPTESPQEEEDTSKPTPENTTLFQAFEWHTPSTPPSPQETHAKTSHYARLTRLLPSLAELGITSLWLPPGCKANSPTGNGYDCYDLWDLGEFDQKFARSTRWGSREELNDLLRTAHEAKCNIIWDTILNHKTAGDSVQEGIWAVEVDGEDRRVETCKPKKIDAWLKYDFPGREREDMKYSDFRWEADCFNGVDWDQKTERNAIYKLIDDPATYPKPKQTAKEAGGRLARFARKISTPSSSKPERRPGKGWADDVGDMHGNFDYLMFANIDHKHPGVRTDLLNWGDWMVWDIGVDGFRLDAAQHYSSSFTKEWLARVQKARSDKGLPPAFTVGEVWMPETPPLIQWLDAVGTGAHAFDAPLLYNFSRISEDVRTGSANADLRTLLRGSLLEERPGAAVTIVTNHDTQPGQTSHTPVEQSLKALFYAFILLRREGTPCVFWGDLYGTHGPKAEGPACCPAKSSTSTKDGSKEKERSVLPSLIAARKKFAYGRQTDYMDAMSCVGFTRAGTHDRPGCAVLLSIDKACDKKGKVNWTIKRMKAGKKGEVWVDVLGSGAEVEIDGDGEGLFTCRGGEVGVFVKREDAVGFPVGWEADVYGS